MKNEVILARRINNKSKENVKETPAISFSLLNCQFKK
jgi:hypothetical protein